ncbi:MAG: SMP-30/gluconolactonase/LRE family protein [Sphingomonas sp.]|uniref:SMP-30/gluconolactonase/LRE family protein n=1 Tax=Sphingomonas sp. TaxID=28214 RepID=UPI0025E0911C|nr:SMP-30/gluconolactonase/LRE family protein [Sphingomonas sp.]MBX9880641.1 SMP-30/gluconolactonase/LRE family protein [Sphingomonas sp.]
MKAELVWSVGARLGEGPLWVPERGWLWFVDIKQGVLHRFTPEGGARNSFPLGGQPSFVVAADDGGLVIGSDLQLFGFRPETGLTPLVAVPATPGDRTNDGCVDRAGRLWFGTMHDGERDATGRIWCYRHGAAAPEPLAGGCVITNGPAVSPDGAWLYHVDTLAGIIWRHALHDDGGLGPGTRFAEIAPSEGHPDGIVCDAEGGLWVALWGGAAAVRYSPAGQRTDRVALPCAQPTKLALGGRDLRTAYVTSAAIGLDPAAHPHAGGLFAFEVAVPGFAAPKVAL